MARVIVNSFLRDALGASGAELALQTQLELDAATLRGLLKVLEEKYPGCQQVLAHAAVAIDGDIYTDALTQLLADDSELVFIHAIEGG